MTGAVETSFGRAARKYLEHAQVQRAAAAWLAAWAPPPEARTGRALELGAGPGVLTDFLLPWGGARRPNALCGAAKDQSSDYLATDLSAAMCAAGASRWPQIAWRRAAAERPPAGPWDWVFSSSMLQWLEEPPAALRAIRAVMAPTGRLLVGCFLAPTLPEWEAVMAAVVGGRPRAVHWLSLSDWQLQVERAGFQVLRAESQTRIYPFPSARAFLRSLHATGAAPYRRLAAPALRRALAAYDALTPQEGVRSTWTFCRIEARCLPTAPAAAILPLS